jgi:hypothetical protein
MALSGQDYYNQQLNQMSGKALPGNAFPATKGQIDTQIYQNAPDDAFISPDYSSIVKRQQDISDKYQQQLPSTQEQKYGIAADEGRLNLAQSLAGADRSANSRGLLYGGVRQGLRSTAESNAASSLMNQRNEINQDTQSTGKDITNTAIEAGLKKKADIQSVYDSAYNEALARKTNSDAQAQGLMGTAASLGALAFGGAGAGTGVAGGSVAGINSLGAGRAGSSIQPGIL